MRRVRVRVRLQTAVSDSARLRHGFDLAVSPPIPSPPRCSQHVRPVPGCGAQARGRGLWFGCLAPTPGPFFSTPHAGQGATSTWRSTSCCAARGAARAAAALEAVAGMRADVRHTGVLYFKQIYSFTLCFPVPVPVLCVCFLFITSARPVCRGLQAPRPHCNARAIVLPTCFWILLPS